MSLLVEAARLFRRKGYAATGTNEILAAAGAPRGSFYHYFPDGKEELGAKAIEAAAKRVTLTIRDLATSAVDAEDFARRYIESRIGFMARAGFAEGCPITTTLLETVPGSARITVAGRTALSFWTAEIARMLERFGWTADAAGRTARFILMASGGAQVHARVEGHAGPLHDCADELCRLLRSGPPANERH